MQRSITSRVVVVVLGVLFAAATAASVPEVYGQDTKPKQPDAPKKDEPSLKGTWKGEVLLATTKWKVASTFRDDGTYKTVMTYANRVMADTGTYKYVDGILTTEPEGGVIGTFTVTFDNKDTMKLKGNGFSITFKRE
ncbi:MAG: hypothetical protein U0804_19175 [Gemmataceae bacterium]